MSAGSNAPILFIAPLLAAIFNGNALQSLLGNLYWILPAAIVVICAAIGIRDLGRLRPGRIMAIADACFTESLRRKVLLVTPLAILGLIVVMQLQEPATEQDAVRQTIRFCLFASGLLVAVMAIILACTNLPREIESRVIYTIVTKPTTRLEIVLGKVVGFAGVSAAILLIMGVFTFGYLEVRNLQLVNGIKRELNSRALPSDSPLRPTLSYYATAGLLATKSTERPASLQVFSFAPGQHDAQHRPGYHYAGGGEGNFFTVPFELNEDQLAALQQAQNTGTPLIVECNLQIIQHTPSAQQLKDIKNLGLHPRVKAKPSDIYGPILPTTPSTNPADLLPVPQVQVRLLDAGQEPLTEFGQIDGHGTDVPATGVPGYITLKADLIEALLKNPRFYLEFSAVTPAVEFGVNNDSISLFIPSPQPGRPAQVTIRPAVGNNGRGTIDFLTRSTRYGMQLISRAPEPGHPEGVGPVADYHFEKVSLPSNPSQTIPFELAVNVEKSGDFDIHGFRLARMSIQFYNRTTDQTSQPIQITPELGRANYVEVPQSFVDGGNFDMLVRGLSPGQLVDLKPDSASLITANRSFAFNLFKSLFILWMLSVLVVIISVFCSTFLSWPIAVVLTLVILLGHWGVNELGDAMAPGYVGRSIATDFNLRDPVSSKVVSSSVDALSKALQVLSTVLPDVSKFSVIEDIEQNVSIPAARVEDAVGVLLMFGLPLLLLSYIILRNKEVAP